MAATLNGADAGFSDSVNRLLKDTGSTLTSGYRNTQEQQGLWDTAVKKYGSEAAARKYVAKPGSSNHEHGFAADIANYDKIDDATLSKYGLYRPMSWEPWHVEPIGHRGQADAYTTPNINTPAAKTIESFGQALSQLLGGDGSTANVGQAPSSVGVNPSAVGTDAMDAATSTRQATEPPDAAMTMPTAGHSAANESEYASLFNSAGAKYGINPKILQEVARQESGFNAGAKNASGATGLMQIMPGTAKGLGVNAADPAQSVDGAARLLSGYMEQYHGDLSKALAAYNAGPGAVAKYGGVPPYKETQQYVKNITAKVNS